MRHITTDRNNEMFIYDSLEEYTGDCNPVYFVQRGTGFVGRRFDTWDEVQDATRRPWQEGLDVLNRYLREIESADLPEIKSHKRRVQFDESEGDEVDYDRLRSGQPFWRRASREQADGPTVVTIYIDTTTPCNRKSEDILWRGAAAIALAKLLEGKGYSVEMWIVNGSRLYRGNRKPVMFATNLKRASDPLDTSTLVNSVSGWYYRTVHFTMLDSTCDRQRRSPESGYGSCVTPSQDDLDSVSRDEIRVYSSGVFSYTAALGMLRSELQRVATGPVAA